MGPATALRAVHFLYPSDIIGVIFRHHRGGSTTREADRFHPRVLARVHASRPRGALLGDSQRLGMECVPTMGQGIATRGERQRGGRRASDDA
jgi:hypothetical protein